MLSTWLPMYLMNSKYAEPTHVYWCYLALSAFHCFFGSAHQNCNSTIGTALARMLPYIAKLLYFQLPSLSCLRRIWPSSARPEATPLVAAIGISILLAVLWMSSNETLNILSLFGIGYLWVRSTFLVISETDKKQGPIKPFILSSMAYQVDEEQRMTLVSILLAAGKLFLPFSRTHLMGITGSIGGIAGPYAFSRLVDFTSLSLLPLAGMILLLLQGLIFLRMPARPEQDGYEQEKRMQERSSARPLLQPSYGIGSP